MDLSGLIWAPLWGGIRHISTLEVGGLREFKGGFSAYQINPGRLGDGLC